MYTGECRTVIPQYLVHYEPWMASLVAIEGEQSVSREPIIIIIIIILHKQAEESEIESRNGAFLAILLSPMSICVR